MPRTAMTIAQATEIVSSVLAGHGDEIDLRDLLAALPEQSRPLVSRMFSELRKRGAIKTMLEVSPETGEVSHRVTVNKTLTPLYNRDGE